MYKTKKKNKNENVDYEQHQTESQNNEKHSRQAKSPATRLTQLAEPLLLCQAGRTSQTNHCLHCLSELT